MNTLATSLAMLAAMAVGTPVLAEDEERKAHFHHVRINTPSVGKSVNYYQRYFGAVPVKYAGTEESLFVERSFLLFNPVPSPPPAELHSSIWHIGWGGIDIPNEYQWLKRNGADFHTPPQPLPGINNHYMYLRGPSGELIEINTMGHHRFAHVHFFADDVNKTCAWYAKHLGLAPRRAEVSKPKGDPSTLLGIWMNFINCDNVQMIFFGKPDFEKSVPWWPDAPLKEMKSTKGRAIDHLAFSYPDVSIVHERMKREGADVLSEPAVDTRYGFRSFFVQGPDQVLIEIVESPALPDVLWQKRS